MTEPLSPYDPHAAKIGGAFRPHVGCRCTDEAVKEPAVQRQLRIRRRHLERASIGPIAKNFEAPKPCPTRASSAIQVCYGRSGSTPKSALVSRSCGCFCPAAAVDTTGPHDRLEKAQKMHEFNKFGVTSPLHPARWHSRRVRSGVPAEYARGSEYGRRGRVIDEVSGQTRTHVDGFGMQQPPELCAITLSASGKRLSNPLLRVRSEATQQHRTSLSLRYGMGVAMTSAMRVADPSAQPGQEEA